jgi:hypothetical protein
VSHFTVLERTESISKIKGATKASVRLMRSTVELDEGRVMRTSWSRGQATHTQIHQFPEKPSKLGLIGVWHKLVPRQQYYWKWKLPPKKYWFANEKYKDDTTKSLFFDNLFFSSLENHGREIILPTHTHTQSATNK